jgi:CheY-like chemotaxis protein
MAEFDPKKFLILVVDDVPRNLQVVGAMLDRLGYATTFATGGKEALARLHKTQPDLILLDLMMPEMDGLQLCDKLKSDSRYASIPIIFLTANQDDNKLLEAFQLGAADYITKPFNPNELLVRVKTHLQLKYTTDQLLVAKAQADQIAKVKDEILSNISHEVRTPIHAIMGYSQLLLEGEQDKEKVKWLKTITNNTERLLSLVNNIIDLSDLRTSDLEELDLDDFDPKKLVQQILVNYQRQADLKQIKLTSTIDPLVPDRLLGKVKYIQQILCHLLDNGIKFTPNEGSVEIQLALLPPRDQDPGQGGLKLYFAVKDNGIGIDPSLEHKLFVPFSQADQSPSRSYQGLGVGLALCKELVDILGGDINVISEWGYGSTFWFTVTCPELSPNYQAKVLDAVVPSLKVEAEQSPPITDITDIKEGNEARDQPEEKQLRILIAEDIIVNQKVLVSQLKKLGQGNTECANNGAEALNVMKDRDYDLMFMDCQMPILDGYQTTAAWRTYEQKNNRQHLTIVGLTAYAMEGDMQKCLDAGMDDYITKPLSLEQLRLILNKYSHLSEQKHQETTLPFDQTSTFTAVDDLLANPSDAPGELAEPFPPPLTDQEELPGDHGEGKAPVTSPQTQGPSPHGTEVSEEEVTEVTKAPEDGDISDLIDYARLEQYTDGNHGLMVSFLTEFVISARSYLEEIKAAYKSQDSTLVAAIAHKIKGSAATIGVPKLVQIAKIVECAAKASELQDLEQNFATIEVMLQRIELYTEKEP